MNSNSDFTEAKKVLSPYAFLLFFEQDRALMLRLLWQGSVGIESLQVACKSSRAATLERLRQFAQQKLIVKTSKQPEKEGADPSCEFTLCLPSDAMPDVKAFLGLYDPPLTGLDLMSDKYMLRYKECQESLLRVFEWECDCRGKFTWNSLIRVADFIGLPIKTCCHFLEYMEKIKPTTWDVAEAKYGITSKKLREQEEFQSLGICSGLNE